MTPTNWMTTRTMIQQNEHGDARAHAGGDDDGDDALAVFVE